MFVDHGLIRCCHLDFFFSCQCNVSQYCIGLTVHVISHELKEIFQNIYGKCAKFLIV